MPDSKKFYLVPAQDKYECDCQKNGGVCMRAGLMMQGYYDTFSECDGFNDCGDWSDEKDCELACEEDQYVCDCYSNGNCDLRGKYYFSPCYEPSYKCDADNDCGDWSDEKDCNYQCGLNELACDCFQNNSTCGSFYIGDLESISTCYPKEDQCKNQGQCSDYSDNKNCTCEGNQLKCGCILKSDNCTSALGCIEIHEVLDGFIDCADSSDEACDIHDITLMSLTSKSHATDHDTLTGSVYQCNDYESYHRFEELKQIAVNSSRNCHFLTIFSGENFTRIDKQWWCASNDHWENGVAKCENKEFVLFSNLCNQNSDCKDGSDEMYDVPGFKCRAKSEYFQLKQSCVLPQVNLYNNNSYCEDGSDNCFVDGKLKCFRCLDEKLMISPKQVCDGVIDCYDLSDECLCQDQTVCDNVLGNSRQSCPPNEMICNGVCLEIDNVLCNKMMICNDSLNSMYCTVMANRDAEIYEYKFCPTDAEDSAFVTASVCDGLPECFDRSDECNVGCPSETHFCLGSLNCHEKLINAEASLRIESYCDGRPFISPGCEPGFDEKNCTSRFYCRNMSSLVWSVEQVKVCDGVLDCADGSDEVLELCKDTRFYCLNKQPLSVDRSRVENGFKDCSDGSDECPVNTTRATVFSTPFEMIGTVFIRVLMWIMGILSLIGNGLVFLFTVIEIRKKNEPIKTSFLWFVINLSLSDFLMGVYLVAISSKGAEYSGRYCYHDAEWRSSNLCSGFGSLTIISSEVSALTMAVMATFRLISVYKPFKMTNVKRVAYMPPTFIVWAVGILLGTIPLIQTSSGYFVSSIWFPNYFASTDIITKDQFMFLYKSVSRYHTNISSPTLNWDQAKHKMAETFKELEIKAEFGYYGETSVCMPKLFVTVGEAVWEYSAFLIVLNFCLFMYVVAVYIALFKRSTKMKNSARRSNKLQKTISLLILTNFCCWIPICIMAFVSLSGVQLDRIVYVISAGVLLPINSVINPIIYSDIGRIAVQKLIKTFKKPVVSTPRMGHAIPPSSNTNRITTITSL
ncbi:uncharacterized protein LOC108950168 [Ciona intestinalis]